MDAGGLTPGDPLGGGPLGGGPPDGGREPFGASPEDPRARAYGSSPTPPGAFVPRAAAAPWPPPEAELASWGRRVAATIVDGLIVGGATLALLVVLGAGAGVFGDGDAGAGGIIVAALLGTVIFAALALLYAPLVMARTNGQTLGKMLAGCRVVRSGGRRTDFLWSAWREVVVKGVLLGIASSVTGGIAYLVDALWPLFDGQRRALHDHVVDSRVVRA